MTLSEAKKFIDEQIGYLGLAFHPDTDFSQYVDYRTDEPLFSAETAEIANNKMADAFDAFDLADEDIYEYCLEQL